MCIVTICTISSETMHVKEIVCMNYRNEMRTRVIMPIMKAIYALLLIIAILNVNGFITHKFLFSKAVVLRRWESET